MRTDQRKHRIQMNPIEIGVVEDFIHAVRYWTGLNQFHVKQRLNEWRVPMHQVFGALRNGKVIEAHANNAPEIRAVMRHDFGKRSICVAVSLTNRRIVTVWVNDSTDHHRTLRLNEYNWGADLVPIVKGL